MEEANIKARSAILVGLLAMLALLPACQMTPQYGTEDPLYLSARQRQVWAVAPAINLSGEREVDPLLQADLLYSQLQQVHGVTVIPVNRVV